MRAWAGLQRREAGQGFTLIEVLLATVILLLLLGAVVFSFSSLERGARLDEGALQFEALLRFARAQALSSGRKVQVLFEEPLDPGVALVLDTVRVTWEPDPLGKPGVFEDLPQTKDYLERINELVRVDNLRLIGPGDLEMAAGGAGETGLGEEEVWEELDFFPPIRFFPDGSSDSAEIVLASREEEDTRRVHLRLLGITGTLKKFVPEEDNLNASNEIAAIESETTGSVERPRPGSKLPAEAGPAAPTQDRRAR
jgi:prepilin-type N-terminal cleavage/methylation domain-containing protein